MRLLFVSGAYPPASGGSELSAHVLITELQRRGHSVHVLTGLPVGHGWPLPESEGTPVTRCSEKALAAKFAATVNQMRPDVVLTQLTWSERVMRWSREAELPVVLFVRSAGGDVDLSTDANDAPTAVVANSRVTADYVAGRWGRASTIIAPLIRLVDARRDDDARADAITMFNPSHEKGGDRFAAVARRLPERQFLAVEGWHNWKDESGQWDRRLLRSAARSYGSVTVIVPQSTDFSNVPNVEMLPATPRVGEIYARTRLLMVPSRWPEPFGRVIVEAMSNGIPVLCSGTGSMLEAAGNAAIVISEPDDPDAWAAAVRALDDQHRYAEWAAATIRQAARYDLAGEIKKVDRLLVRVAGRVRQ